MSEKMPYRCFACIVGLASFALAILLPGKTARATIVTMDFTGAEGNNSGGVYVYPYEFEIDSSSSNSLLMCDDFVHEITAGETWTASTLKVTDLNSMNVNGLQYPSAGVTGYLEASYLFGEEVTAYTAGNSDPDGLYNWAVWDLMTNSDVSNAALNNSGQEAQVQSYLSAAEALGSSLTPSQFPNVIIYTPTDMTSGGPQEFFGYGIPSALVPEPATFGLLGLGAVGLLARRQKRAAH